MHGLIRINVFIDADKRFAWQRIGIKMEYKKKNRLPP